MENQEQKRKDQHERIRKAAEPLLKILNEEFHPHHTLIMTSTSIEISEGVLSIPKIYDFLVD